MTLFVDTSVWSLALRRDAVPAVSEVTALVEAIRGGEALVTAGLVLQELLQGFLGPKAQTQILERFSAVPLLVPDRNDHVEAAALKNRYRRGGVQIGTIDALLAQLCIRHELTMLTSDNDFKRIAERSSLRLWKRP